MRLEPPNIGKLMNAIASSFNQAALDQLFFARLGHTTDNYIGIVADNNARALALVQNFQSRNEIEVLIALLRDARPKVVELAELAQVVGLFTVSDTSALQAVVRPTKGGTIGFDPRQFRADLAEREDRVCRITLEGQRYGTGTLIGPDLVLTNFHVVEPALQPDGRLGGKVLCEFDHRQATSGFNTPKKEVAVTAVIASSPYAQEDKVNGPVNQSLACLDYALLRLAEDVASAPIVDGGEPRGYTPITPAPVHPLLVDQGILVLQHPSGEPLTLDLGGISALHPTRVRHTANTKGGSSGSPIFDGDLTFVALHHAGYDWPDTVPSVNQAIPIGLIVNDIAAKNITLQP